MSSGLISPSCMVRCLKFLCHSFCLPESYHLTSHSPLEVVRHARYRHIVNILFEMPRVKQLGKRAQSKEDRLRERRERALERNQLDLVKEKQEREELYLDEGASESGTSNDDTDTEEFFISGNRVEQKPEKDTSKGSDQLSDQEGEQEEELEEDDEIDDEEDYEDFNIPDDIEDEEDDDIDELVDGLDLPEDIDEAVDNPESEDESPQEVSSKRPADWQENEKRVNRAHAEKWSKIY
ncbi:hypothetical protein DdX_00022 [Ditylenchus destructor]|uniref:Uncharacterized protein n=1 Tax=Ditylenchus destructor TaxID=166010 RepID=A0AAD4NJU6_9BILA|nr:hypothetical protein DdX_00022 [Ditylenchus destructor]